VTQAHSAARPATILHVDLDAFFASVEQRDRPELRGRPVVVGGLGHRGVVAAASYEARRFDVYSAMPTERARRACPDAIFLAPRFDAYVEASGLVMAILRSVTPLVEPLSLDEAFLDVGGARRRAGSAAEIGTTLRARIRTEVGLTASVGAASTKLLAKLASEDAKPDGLLVVEPGTEPAYLEPLPVTRLWGVGPATRRRLTDLGVTTVGELAAIDPEHLVARLGRAAANHLHALARNQDERVVDPNRIRKSVGHEETFATDRRDRAGLERELTRMAERVAQRLRDARVAARTVAIKVRYPDFRTITRSHTAAEPTDLAVEIGARARELLRGVDVEAGVRLLGITVQQLVEGAAIQEQLPLDGAADDLGDGRARRRALADAVDEVRRRFGDGVVSPRARDTFWGPDDDARREEEP